MKCIIAILNQKGGVGKTTTAINLCAYLARSKKNVLLIDLDPQGNATSGLGLDKENAGVGSYELLINKVDLTDTIHESSINNLFIIPANANLAAAEVELVSQNNRELILKEQVSSLDFDYAIIDCPPSLGLLSINALSAADYVLIPVQAEYYALEGLGQLLNVMQRVRSGLNPSLTLLGVVLTMYNSRTSLSEQVRTEVQKHFGTKVFDTLIPRNIRLAEAPSYGHSIFEHDKWSKGARAYKQFGKEVEKRVNK